MFEKKNVFFIFEYVTYKTKKVFKSYLKTEGKTTFSLK